MNTRSTSMISCDDYDYIEIACLYGLVVELHYVDSKIVGQAKDTQRGENGEEGLVLEINNQLRWMPLDGLTAMIAVTTNPHFNRVDFCH